MSTTLQLRQLLEQSRNLANSVSAKKDLPPIERNLEEIETQSRKFASKVTRPGEQPEKKAPFFLAKWGIDGEKLENAVRSINVLGAFEPRELVSETDISSYAEYKYRSTVSSIIEDGHNQTIKDYYNDFEKSLNLDWEKTKNKIFEELGQYKLPVNTPSTTGDQSRRYSGTSATRTPSRAAPSTPSRMLTVSETPFRTGAGVSYPNTPAGMRSLGTPWTATRHPTTPRSEAATLFSAKMTHYAEVVLRLNESRLHNEDFGVINSFLNAAKKINSDRSNKLIIECWRAFAQIVGEENVLDGHFQRNPLKELQYFNLYQNQQGTSFYELQRRLLNGARQYLEDQYNKWVDDYIASHRKEAQMGGIPLPRNKAEAFMRAFHRPNGGKPMDNLEVCSTLCGNLTEALAVARDYERHLHRNDKTFITYFAEYLQKNRRLPREQREQLVAEIKQRVKLSAKHPQDYYKLTMYHILAQLPLTTIPNTAIPSTEDYLWFNLMIVQHEKEVGGIGNESLTIGNFQKHIIQFGPNTYTSDGKDPVQYFRALLISAQFERAVDYLNKTDFSVEAVHFGIALAYYGLLRVPENQDAMATLLENGDGINAYLNFNGLIHHYVERFYSLRQKLAVHYYSFLYLYGHEQTEAARNQVELSNAYIRKLVYDTRNFEELLGNPRKNLASIGEIPENLPLLHIHNDAEFKAKIIAPLGRQFELDHKYKQALELFELAEEYSFAISVLNKMLGEYIWIYTHQQASVESDEELDPQYVQQKFTQYIQERLLNRCSTMLIRDCELLLDLTEFVKFYNQKDYVRALELIERMNIVPLEADMAEMAKRNQELSGKSEEIRRNYPAIMLLTMECLYECHQQLKTRPSPGPFDTDSFSKMHELQRKARNIMQFVGFVKNSLPSDIYNRLAHFEVLMR
ncbi:8653_t:CDS:10 [Ambispora gerdemannii]|uniref:Nuclear pore protein n=1 Tax=Ambispora gerdemannii TaxID=144530 RepID=A0A9N9A679_9GLOM|nr:8653_t:CDS:10 [Ambispora gerdemannii]